MRIRECVQLLSLFILIKEKEEREVKNILIPRFVLNVNGLFITSWTDLQFLIKDPNSALAAGVFLSSKQHGDEHCEV